MFELDLESKIPRKGDHAFGEQNMGIFFDGFQKKEMDFVFEDPRNEFGTKTIHIASNSAFSPRQLLAYLLCKAGRSDVWIASFAFSMPSAEMVGKLKREGLIDKLSIILDNTINTKVHSAFMFLQKIGTIKLVSVHAKIIVIKNAKWTICVTGSPNMSDTHKLEVCQVFFGAEESEFYIKTIEKAISEVIE